jgi:hypothetical protein
MPRQGCAIAPHGLAAAASAPSKCAATAPSPVARCQAKLQAGSNDGTCCCTLSPELLLLHSEADTADVQPVARVSPLQHQQLSSSAHHPTVSAPAWSSKQQE